MTKLQQTSLADIGKVLMCKRVLKHQTLDYGGIPFFKISTFGGKPDTFIPKELYENFRKKYSYPKKGDILISAAGTVGKTVVFDGQPAYFQDSNIVWLDNDESKITNDYLYYFYQTNPWVTTDGSTIKRIYNENLRSIKVSFPDIIAQQKISAVLSSLDSKIELNNKINAELEKMAKLLYDFWFVQFEFPDKNGKPYKTSGGKMVWSEELKRDVPDGWDIDKLNTRIKIGSGFPFDSDDYNNVGKYKIITIKNVQDNSLETNTADKIDFIPQNLSKFCKLEIGDVLMSLTGNVGRMCFVDEDNLLLNQRVGKILGEKDFIIFGYLYFKRPENQKRLEKISGGSSQANLSPVDAVKDYFAIPPDNILNEFSKIVTPIFNQIINNKKENKKLVELRDWLLPMLMNGQIKVN